MVFCLTNLDHQLSDEIHLCYDFFAARCSLVTICLLLHFLVMKDFLHSFLTCQEKNLKVEFLTMCNRAKEFLPSEEVETREKWHWYFFPSRLWRSVFALRDLPRFPFRRRIERIKPLSRSFLPRIPKMQLKKDFWLR